METKNKQITLLQGKAMIVELPEGATNPRIEKGYLWYDDDNFIGVIARVHLSQKYNWRIIGMLSEVTESEAAGLVENVGNHITLQGDAYENYQDGDSFYETALESLESAILAEGYGFDSEPEPSYSDCEQYENPLRTYEGRLREWNSRQSRVLDRSRCLLLGREG